MKLFLVCVFLCFCNADVRYSYSLNKQTCSILPSLYITGLKENLIFTEESDQLTTTCEATYVYSDEGSLRLTCNKWLLEGFAEDNYKIMKWRFGDSDRTKQDLSEKRTKRTLYNLTYVFELTSNDNCGEIICEIQKNTTENIVGREMLIIKLEWRAPETNKQDETNSEDQQIKENDEVVGTNSDQQTTIFASVGAVGALCLALIVVIVWMQVRHRKEDRVPMINSTDDTQESTRNDNQFPPNLESVYSKPLDEKEETVTYSEPYFEKDINELYSKPIPKSQRTKNRGVEVLPTKWTQEYAEINVNKLEHNGIKTKQAKTKKNPKYGNIFLLMVDM